MSTVYLRITMRCKGSEFHLLIMMSFHRAGPFLSHFAQSIASAHLGKAEAMEHLMQLRQLMPAIAKAGQYTSATRLMDHHKLHITYLLRYALRTSLAVVFLLRGKTLQPQTGPTDYNGRTTVAQTAPRSPSLPITRPPLS